jgi:type I protein arginine methyltransferase
MYSVLDYGRMASDGVRIDAYARAIARAVKPGDVVLDLGSGTGIFSLLAVRAGASRVFAVDVNPAVWLVPELAAENQAGGRITVHHGSSIELDLPEKADVIVSDMRGTSPLNGDHAAAIRDARTRFLKPGGLLVPARDRLFVEVVESDALAAGLARGWQSLERLGFSAAAVKSSILNTVYDDRSAPLLASDVISTPGQWGELDYATYDGAVVEGAVDLAITRNGTAHGLAVWFEATVFDDISYRSAPGWSLAYARSFLPLLEPVRMAAGERATVTLRADARGDRWAWETKLSGADATTRAQFKQATFLGTPTAPEMLLRTSTSHRPVLSAKGQRLRSLLAAMDGERSVADLGDELARALPEGSPLRALLLEEVREAVSHYAR